jgi:two-component system OmpR family sensor kinase
VTFRGPGSVTERLTRSLLVGLTLLWLAGVFGSGIVLKHLIDEKSDDELHESGMILMTLVRHIDDPLVTAALLGDKVTSPQGAPAHERMVYQIREASGPVLLRSGNAPPELLDASLVPGFADVAAWRVLTLEDAERRHFLQLADPLAERRDALLKSLAWLTAPLAALLAFAVFIVYRASNSLVQQVRRTANAVSRQDPQALGLLPLDGVVTEMRPAVEATNRLLARLAAALEAERSFTYNSAHELRTPIAAALAQAQLLAARAEDTALREPAGALVAALSRLTRLAERLLALARADGAQALADEWVDLSQVVRLTVDEFSRNARLQGRSIVAHAAPVRVRGDLDAIGLALRNLVENALVHGAGGSFIRVTCAGSRAGVSLAVTDDGPGVAPAELPSLIKRFARGSAAAEIGAGLGLSIVDTLARRMGAKLELISPLEGRGNGFEARLVWRAPSG